MAGEAGLRGRRVVLGVSGGIAAYKAALVARLLVRAGVQVDAVLTRGAGHFVGRATFEGITGRPCHADVFDDVAGQTHVALARAADAVLVYPATAHLMARAATGLADDLLTTTLLAATCPVVLAPAMHTEMWQHPATQDNAKTLLDRGVILVGPAEGPLMGGDSGPGRVVGPDEALAAVTAALGTDDRADTEPRAHVAGTSVVDEHAPRDGDLAGRTIVVTAGGTREHLDPVRFLGNRSSGKMGFALAARAARRGARVHLVAAPTHLATPPGVERHDVVSALDMQRAVLDLLDGADVVVKAAAVADFRPSAASERKLKKRAGTPELTLTATPDILAELGADRTDRGAGTPLLVGFAAETDDVEANGRDKLASKGADLLVVNDVGASDAGFEVDTNRVVILTRDGGRIDVPLTSKDEVAERVLDTVAARLT